MGLLIVNKAVTGQEPEDAGEAIPAGRLQEQNPTALAGKAPLAHPSSDTPHHPPGGRMKDLRRSPRGGRSV